MSTSADTPLQKYGQLLGKSIKQIECEVDPDAIIICKMNQNLCNKNESNDEIENENSEEDEGKNNVEQADSSDNESIDKNKPEKTIAAAKDTDEETNSSVDLPAATTNEQTVNSSSDIAADGIVLSKPFAKKKRKMLPKVTDVEMPPVEESSLQTNQSASPQPEEIGEEATMDINPETIASNINDPVDEFTSVSQRLSIEEYSQDEWKGQTYTAECMQLGYKKIIEETHCMFLRKIRGDNYCGLRATMFQCLTRNIKILSSIELEELVNIPKTLIKEYKCDWLMQWSFADRIPSTPISKIDILKDCLSYLAEQINISNSLPDDESRDTHFTAIFNSGTNKEIYLFEAVKLLMLYEAVKLYKDYIADKEVPVFAWLLFARDTSDSPENLMLKHFNLVGQSGGLEQVEMCLLGYTLCVTINVFRPSKSEEEDFVSFYPDHQIGKWYNLYLVAEDDRHYNIVTE